MGKTYRKVNSGSQSEDYHSDHNRGFAKKKKRNSHHSVRNKNKNKCEDEFDTRISNKMKDHWASKYYGELGNVPE